MTDTIHKQNEPNDIIISFQYNVMVFGALTNSFRKNFFMYFLSFDFIC